MQGSYGPGIVHIVSGLKILAEVQYDPKTDTHQHEVLKSSSGHVPMSTLLEMFTRLDHQITDVWHLTHSKQRCTLYLCISDHHEKTTDDRWHSWIHLRKIRRFPRQNPRYRHSSHAHQIFQSPRRPQRAQLPPLPSLALHRTTPRPISHANPLSLHNMEARKQSPPRTMDHSIRVLRRGAQEQNDTRREERSGCPCPGEIHLFRLPTYGGRFGDLP